MGSAALALDNFSIKDLSVLTAGLSAQGPDRYPHGALRRPGLQRMMKI
jgi:hypothetical protein